VHGSTWTVDGGPARAPVPSLSPSPRLGSRRHYPECPLTRGGVGGQLLELDPAPARLGARGTIFGSRAVNRLFNQLQGEEQLIMLKGAGGEEAQMLIRVRIGDLTDKLQAQIRSELGADAIGHRPT
jgi:hypothetical protein